jgi:hypothetical protein
VEELEEEEQKEMKEKKLEVGAGRGAALKRNN